VDVEQAEKSVLPLPAHSYDSPSVSLARFRMSASSLLIANAGISKSLIRAQQLFRVVSVAQLLLGGAACG